MRCCLICFGEGGSSSNEWLQHMSLGLSQYVMRNVSDTWQLLGITKANKQKDRSRIMRISLCSCVALMLCSARGREELSVGWHGYHFTLRGTVYTSVFLYWWYFSLLNTGVCFLIILEENVFILKWCFLDLPILFPFSVFDLKEVLLPLHFPCPCILLSLICVVHLASLLFAWRYVVMWQAFIEELVCGLFYFSGKVM